MRDKNPKGFRLETVVINEEEMRNAGYTVPSYAFKENNYES